MATTEKDHAESLAKARNEWSVAVPAALMLLVMVLSPLLFDLLQ